MPARATIDRNIHAPIGADIQHISVDRIFAHHVDRLGGQIAADRSPGTAQIVADVDHRAGVVIAVIVEADVGTLERVTGRDHAADPMIGQTRRYVAPIVAAAGSDPDIAIVSARPDQTELLGRFADRSDRGKGHIAAIATAGQIGADRIPGVAPIK